MRYIMSCRRSIISLTAIGCLTAIGLLKGIDVSFAIAGVAGALAGSNAYEGARRGKQD